MMFIIVCPVKYEKGVNSKDICLYVVLIYLRIKFKN